MSAKRSGLKKALEGEAKNAPRAMLEEFFDDMYRDRWRVYKMNLIRGIFFGFGSVVGGTLVVALIVWVLLTVASIFDNVPILSDAIEGIRASFEAARHR